MCVLCMRKVGKGVDFPRLDLSPFFTHGGFGDRRDESAAGVHDDVFARLFAVCGLEDFWRRRAEPAGKKSENTLG